MGVPGFHVVIISDYLKFRKTSESLSSKGIAIHFFDENKKVFNFVESHPVSLFVIDKTLIDAETKELCTSIRKKTNCSTLPIVLSVNKLNLKDIISNLSLGIDFIIGGPVDLDWIDHFFEVSYEKVIDNRNPSSVRYEFNHDKYSLPIEPKRALTLLLSVIDDFVQSKDRVNTYIGIAAHDIRNPLAVILNATQLFLEKFGNTLPEEGNQLLSMVNNSSYHILQILEEMLDISKLDSAKMQLTMAEIDFLELMQECFVINNALAKIQNIEMTLEVEENLPTIFCDSFKIKQVITNLLTNAIKFSHSKTSIKIVVSFDSEKLYVSVEDHGLGISPQDFSKIFHEFGQTETKSMHGEKSTGLGLAIAKKIIDLHGGEISFSSEKNKGSIFTISLSRNPILKENLVSQIKKNS